MVEAINADRAARPFFIARKNCLTPPAAPSPAAARTGSSALRGTFRRVPLRAVEPSAVRRLDRRAHSPRGRFDRPSYRRASDRQLTVVR